MALELTQEQKDAEWQVKKLGEVSSITMGQSPHGRNVAGEHIGLPLLNGPTEFTAFSPIPVKWTEQITKVAMKNDILFCVRGSTTGRMNIADQQYVIGRGIASLRGATLPDTRYLYFTIQRYLPSLLQRATGSTFPNISGAQLNDFEIPWPPDSVRNYITEVLGSVSDKIEANSRLLDSLSELAIAEVERLGLFSGEPNSVLGDLITFSPKVPKPDSGTYQFIDMSVLPTTGPVTGPISHKENWTGSKFEEGDTLFSRITPCLENGKTAIAMGLGDKPGIGSTEFIVMRALEAGKELLPYGIARNERFREIAIQKMTGTSGRQRVKWQDLASTPVNATRVSGFQLGKAEFELMRSFREENILLASIRNLLIRHLIG